MSRKIEKISIAKAGLLVVMETDKGVILLPWQKANEVASALKQKAKLCATEERFLNRSEAEALVADQEILRDNGVPLNLGLPRDVYANMGGLASSGMGVKGRGRVGRPSVSGR